MLNNCHLVLSGTNSGSLVMNDTVYQIVGKTMYLRALLQPLIAFALRSI